MILSVSRYTAKLEENEITDAKAEDTSINKHEIIAEENLS